MLIRHSKYSAILSKIHSYRLLFGDFAHWLKVINFRPKLKPINFLSEKVSAPTIFMAIHSLTKSFFTGTTI